jgi:glutaredoxin 3
MREIIVYTTNVCPYCVAAKRLLQQRNYPFTEVNLEQDPELRMKLSQENGGYRTVPMIFIGGKFIGGFDELNKLDRAGRLKAEVEG